MGTFLALNKPRVMYALKDSLVSIKKVPLNAHKELIRKKASSTALNAKLD